MSNTNVNKHEKMNGKAVSFNLKNIKSNSKNMVNKEKIKHTSLVIGDVYTQTRNGIVKVRDIGVQYDPPKQFHSILKNKVNEQSTKTKSKPKSKTRKEEKHKQKTKLTKKQTEKHQKKIANLKQTTLTQLNPPLTRPLLKDEKTGKLKKNMGGPIVRDPKTGEIMARKDKFVHPVLIAKEKKMKELSKYDPAKYCEKCRTYKKVNGEKLCELCLRVRISPSQIAKSLLSPTSQSQSSTESQSMTKTKTKTNVIPSKPSKPKYDKKKRKQQRLNEILQLKSENEGHNDDGDDSDSWSFGW